MTPATALSRSPWQSARWLVLAPHADDETLGTGALIADTAARNRLAGVMILTDGSGSHPCPTPADRSTLIRRRRGEARHAVALLTGGRRIVPRFLDWHDANPHRPGSAAFRRSVRQLATLLRRHAVDAIATTAAGEPHCDHAACSRLRCRPRAPRTGRSRFSNMPSGANAPRAGASFAPRQCRQPGARPRFARTAAS
ncbi:PIG-L family deacetylase [Sphingomonas aerolata]|uniref:PIG-L deacetylase family protein n=1 Tax=Sphingomonas aerolata TaxID=185951 RepID=UPI002FDF4A60